MSGIAWRIGLSLLFGVAFALSGVKNKQRGKKNSGIGYMALPLVAVLLLLSPILLSPQLLTNPAELAGEYLTFFHGVTALFISILIYDGVLLLVLPGLRRRITSNRCAELWLIPCVVPIMFSVLIYSRSPFAPQLFWRVDESAFLTLFWVWLGGFLLAMLWQILSHLRFRRQILRDAVPADDSALRVLQEVRKELCVNAQGELVYSRAVQAPLSIGVFNNSLRIVLPLRNTYSPEELRLILRHELIHINQGHNQLKFTMAFVTAFGWFLPTQWLGLRRAAEDLELSCDEQAAMGLSQEERQQYAALILNNAGTVRGFTTCLSTSARGLRYRLSRVLHPEARGKGALAVGIILTLFFLSQGLVGLAPGGGRLGDAIQENRTAPIQVSQLGYHFPVGLGGQGFYQSVDSEGLLDAIEDIRLYLMPVYNGGSLPYSYWGNPYLQIYLEGGGVIEIHRDAARKQCYVYLTDTNSLYLTDRMIDLNALIQYAER